MVTYAVVLLSSECWLVVSSDHWIQVRSVWCVVATMFLSEISLIDRLKHVFGSASWVSPARVRVVSYASWVLCSTNPFANTMLERVRELILF